MGAAVSTHRHDGVTTVTISGAMDLDSVGHVERVIGETVDSPGTTKVVVDLSGVDFLDSSGIASLLKGRRVADGSGVAYLVVGAEGMVRRVLDLTGVWAHLSGEPS
jgi:anti-sigma B factor antagonist